MKIAKIEGGYYIKARKIQDSKVAHMSPCTREIWDYLIKRCNHKDSVVSGRNVLRGQCLITTDEIVEALYWMVGFRKMMYTRRQAEGAMKVLTKGGMIVRMKVVHKTLVTVVNYSKYQDPKNYEGAYEGASEEGTKVTRRSSTRTSINKNEKEHKNKEEIKRVTKSVDLPPAFDSFVSKFYEEYIMSHYPRSTTKIESERKAVKTLLNLGYDKLDEYDKILKFLQSDSFWRKNIQCIGKLVKQKDGVRYFDRMLSNANNPNKPTDTRIEINQPYTILEDRMI